MTGHEVTSMATQTISASEFKAKCLEILDRLRDHSLDRVVVTKRGRPVAVVTPPEVDAKDVRELRGFLRGTVVVPKGVDLTEPLLDEPFDSQDGVLHG